MKYLLQNGKILMLYAEQTGNAFPCRDRRHIRILRFCMGHRKICGSACGGMPVLQDKIQYFFIDFLPGFMYDIIARYGMP